MVQAFLGAALRPAAFVAAGLVLASLPLAGSIQASEITCPQARQELAGGTVLRALSKHLRQREPVEIVAIGSSSTQGVGASSPAQSYPSQLERFLEAAWKTDAVSVENAGIGGETIADTVRRLEGELRDAPDLVIWQVGTNDAVRGIDIEQFRSLLDQGLGAARAAHVDVILLDQQYFPGIKDLPRYEQFVEAVRETAARNKVPVFSRYALMKTWARQSLNELQTMLAGDGFHMSDRGYTCLTEALGSAVAGIVRNGSTGAQAASAAPAGAARPRPIQTAR